VFVKSQLLLLFCCCQVTGDNVCSLALVDFYEDGKNEVRIYCSSQLAMLILTK